MKKLISISVLILATTGLFAQTSVFQGAYFSVNYPSSFTAKGSIVSETAGNGDFDSAIFTSPDGEVSFYIFAPQWDGEATDIEVQANEKMGKKQETASKSKLIIHYTISAKNGSYMRSYQETRDSKTRTTTIIGIKYKNMKAYNKYKNEYLAFKKSLEQIADN